MEKKSRGIFAIILLVLLGVFLVSGDVEIQASINPAVAGGTLTLSLSPPTALNSGSWAVGGSLILTWLGEQQAVFPSYSGRASVNISTGALTLTNVAVADSGAYVLQSTDPQLRVNASISVLAPISNVTLTTNQTSLVEFSGSAVATCSVSSGSSPSLLWLNGSSELTAGGRVLLANGNFTLKIINVTRFDQGPFMCYVSNPVSNGTSNPLNFTILYGPDTMALTVEGQSTVGSNVTLLCSAQSNPPAQLTWAFRGRPVNATGPLLTLYNVTENQSGPYTCQAFNNFTSMNNNITTQITIANSSGSEPQAANLWLLSLLSLVGIIFSLSGKFRGRGHFLLKKYIRMKSPGAFVLILITIIYKTGHVCCLSNTPTIRASENPVRVGSNVTLFSTDNVSTGAWLFNNTIMLIILDGSSIVDNTLQNRIAYNPTTSSLTLNSLTLADSGVYTLDSINVFRANLTLSVQVPISNVTLRANQTNLVEFNDTAVLTCSVSLGSFPSYVWMKGSSVVTAGGRVQLSDGNTTLTLMNVTLYDSGPFSCNVSNGVSYEVSAPVYLNISYGPSNGTIEVEPMSSSHIYRAGSDITLNCSAMSKPPANIMWMANDSYLNQTGPQLQLKNVTVSSSANYKCIFYNAATKRFSSASTMISIMDPLTEIAVNQIGGPAIQNMSFTLYCQVAGNVDSIHWWRNGWPVFTSNNTFVDNKTLSLDPVQRSDDGEYQCQAFNAVSNVTSSPYDVIVNYGPEMPTITGPSVGKTGDNITLSCYASSVPPSTYKWYFNGSLVATTSLLKVSMSGNYVCMAYNNITGLNSTALKTFTVVEPITNVQLEAPNDAAIEGFSYMLTCNVTGPADHVYWFMDGQQLQEDNLTDYMINKTELYFHPLVKNDTGTYQCLAMNAVGNMSSPVYMLLVNFGPEKPVISGPNLAETGQSAVFNCSAMSEPPSQISWWFNDTLVSNSSLFVLDHLSLNMSGEYTCMASNAVTGVNRTNSRVLTVIEAITSVMVKNDTVPTDSKNLTLSCVVTGSYDMIYWLKDNQTLKTDTSAKNMFLSVQNNTLFFTPVTMHNDGMYQCVAVNRVAEHQSPNYNLMVNYGPMNMSITGPDSAKQGVSVSLNCTALSRPNCEYQWFFNGSSLVIKTGPVIMFSATHQNEGDYTCQASNRVTNITLYKTKTFTVASHASAIHFLSHCGLMLMGVFALSLPVLLN
ncbi:hypothetical protein Q5P01_011464 [Channa striata]|uniref:Ig-like domain-containing protein n=1 Tax=Channa striata TaxID=64152 RepID=A0AA88MWZ5_CHASR|nr:hypothetical protein Q5P01_011464 [Channa striata]